MTDFDASEASPRRSRRAFLLVAFGGLLAATGAGAARFVWDFVRPLRVAPASVIHLGKIQDFPRGGDPIRFSPIDGKSGYSGSHGIWVANLDPAERRPGGANGGDGLIAFPARCMHLGCTLPWNPAFDYEGDTGWFRCECHGSTYSKAGIRVFGPAPRSLDTFEVLIDRDGNVSVNLKKVTPGSATNPTRAVKQPPWSR